MVTGIIVVTIALSFQCGHHFQICDLVEVVECDMVQQITYTTTTCALCNRCLKKTKNLETHSFVGYKITSYRSIICVSIILSPCVGVACSSQWIH